MAHVLGIWELGWNTPIKEADLWEMVLRDFSIESWTMTPKSGIIHDWLKEDNDMVAVIDQYRSSNKIVFVDEKGTTPLKDFHHPKDVLYVFGRVSFSPYKAYSKPGDISLRIETTANNGLLWPHQAAGIVLYDRMMKWQ